MMNTMKIKIKSGSARVTRVVVNGLVESDNCSIDSTLMQFIGMEYLQYDRRRV